VASRWLFFLMQAATVITPTCKLPRGKSPAIAIRGRCCGGARGRDRALRLPVTRLHPRAFPSDLLGRASGHPDTAAAAIPAVEGRLFARWRLVVRRPAAGMKTDPFRGASLAFCLARPFNAFLALFG
jgi:hypothetical protein